MEIGLIPGMSITPGSSPAKVLGAGGWYRGQDRFRGGFKIFWFGDEFGGSKIKIKSEHSCPS
jgi:hypothetical protein